MGNPAAAPRLKLLLDEMFPAAIASALRAEGYDVIAVQEHSDLRELNDPPSSPAPNDWNGASSPKTSRTTYRSMPNLMPTHNRTGD